MTAILQDVPEVQRAYEEYRRFSADPVMREKMRSRQRFLDEQQLRRMDVLDEVAVNLKNMGMAPSDIAKATGLPLSDIEGLS